jgi:hypothetical protein
VAVVVPIALAVTAVTAYTFGSVHALRSQRQADDCLIGFKVNEQCGFTLNDLGLSESQAEEYRAIGLAARPELTRLRDRIRGRKTELLQLLRTGTGDGEATEKILGEVASLQAALELRTVDYILSLRSVLTDRQLPKFDRITRDAVCPWL